MVVYNVVGVNMQLKQLTLKELDRVNELLRIVTDGSEAAVHLSNDALAEVLSIILQPTVQTGQPVDFKEVVEEEALQILRDFFLQRLRLRESTRKKFAELTTELNV